DFHVTGVQTCALPILEEPDLVQRRAVDVVHVAERIDARRYTAGQRLLLHERLVEPAVATEGEDLLDHTECVVLRRTGLRRLVAERQGGPVRLRINARVTLLRGLSRLADVRLGRKLDGRDVTEILLDPCLRL